jgi:hypothetical protein
MIYIYFYRIEYSEKSSFYKRNFLNQLIKLVDISEKLERCNEIAKADIIFTIGDFVNDSELVGKKLVVYSLQDNSFTNREILENKNVLFVLDHCKFCNDTSVNSQSEFTSDHCKFCNDISVNSQDEFTSDHCKFCNDTSVNSQNEFTSDHCKFCNDTSVNSQDEFTSDHCKSEEYNKVFCLLNISELYKNKYQSEVLPLSQRKYDVVFMGTTQYDEKITKHRIDVIQNIEKVCIKNNLQYYTSDKPIKYTTYANILNNTKIFISPYGWGEFSLKEYECICFGAHIVKPKIYFEYYPNYCENMDDFEIDFSNFESKILHILSNLDDAQKKVDSNRKMFLDYCINKHCSELENKILDLI